MISLQRAGPVLVCLFLASACSALPRSAADTPTLEMTVPPATMSATASPSSTATVPPPPTAAEFIPDWLAPDERAIAELALADARVVARLEGEHYEFLDVTNVPMEGGPKGDVGPHPPEVALYIYGADKYLRIPVVDGVVAPFKEFYAPEVGFAGLSPREIETAVAIAMADPVVAKLAVERGLRPLPPRRVRVGGVSNSTCETYRCVVVILVDRDDQVALIQVDLGARRTAGMLVPGVNVP